MNIDKQLFTLSAKSLWAIIAAMLVTGGTVAATGWQVSLYFERRAMAIEEKNREQDKLIEGIAKNAETLTKRIDESENKLARSMDVLKAELASTRTDLTSKVDKLTDAITRLTGQIARLEGKLEQTKP